MKNFIIIILSLVIVALGYYLMQKNANTVETGYTEFQEKIVDQIVEKRFKERGVVSEQERADLLKKINEDLESRYCEKNDDCIAVGAPCGISVAFNRDASEAIATQKELTENYQGACTMDIKRFGEPYCKDNICNIDRLR